MMQFHAPHATAHRRVTPVDRGLRMAALLRKFRDENDGTLSIFSIFMFIAIVMVSGIGIDLMFNELHRVKLQATLDRAVLAAADLEQDKDPQAVVEDYFAKAGMSSHLQTVTVNQSLIHREVSATALHESEPLLLHLLGVDYMSAPASGTASESVNNVEVSLILDVSGSMADNNKMTNLKTAATDFIDALIHVGTQDRVSISLVPYSEHVNAGPLITSRMNVNTLHNFSNCLEIPNAEFGTTALNTAITYDQAQHYQWNYWGTYDDVRTPVCPDQPADRILPMSQDATALKAQINALQPLAGTSIFLGMKWGTALLDPTFRPIFTSLIGANEVDSVFSGRPVAYNDANTIKTIVLMTDGQNSDSSRIQSWAYDSPEEITRWSQWNLFAYLYTFVGGSFSNYYESKYTAAGGDILLDNICDAAKAQGILVWTIGFETTAHGGNVMEQCASSPSHYFDVEGADIQGAFSVIAQQITQLRLTQ